MSEKKIEFVMTDIAKMVGACIVVFGHSYLPDYWPWFQGMVRASVQMFFVFTGFFLVRGKTLEDEDKIKRYLTHFFGIILSWAVVYLFWNALFTDRTTESWVSNYLVLVVEGFDSFNSGPMWYMQNLLIVVLVLYVFKKTAVSDREVFVWILLAAVFDSRICRAFSGVLFGMYLAREWKAENVKNVQNFKLRSAIGVASFAAMIGLYQFGLGIGTVQTLIARLCSLVCGMMFAEVTIYWDTILVSRGKCYNSPYTYWARKLSTVVYLMHSAIIPVAMAIVKRILFAVCNWNGEKNAVWSLSVGGVALLISAILGVVMIYLSRYRVFRWLKKMY